MTWTHLEKNATGGNATVNLKIDWFEFDSDDCQVAIQAAQSMARRFREDIAIMPNLAVILLRHAQQPPLEIIRYSPEPKGLKHD